jgi:hypothetical protein
MDAHSYWTRTSNATSPILDSVTIRGAMDPAIQYARTSDGVSIAYYAIGEGPPLVYIVPCSHALLAGGRSNAVIAGTLTISTRTVERHIENIHLTIGAHNRAEATAYAFRQGLVPS